MIFWRLGLILCDMVLVDGGAFEMLLAGVTEAAANDGFGGMVCGFNNDGVRVFGIRFSGMNKNLNGGE